MKTFKIGDRVRCLPNSWCHDMVGGMKYGVIVDIITDERGDRCIVDWGFKNDNFGYDSSNRLTSEEFDVVEHCKEYNVIKLLKAIDGTR